MTAITRALSAALLHFVWQGLGVTIVLWLALFLLRRRSAVLRYAASCAALALLVALPVVTTWVLYEQPAKVAARPSTAPTALLTTPIPSPVRQSDWLAGIEAWAIPVWSCGVLIFSFRMLWGCTQVAVLRRRGESADARLLAAVDALARRMGVARAVRVLLSPAADSPSVTGWLSPVILLPISAIAGLTPDQLEAVLAHELAHIRRHDYLVNLLQMAAETLLFYHPAVWWISTRIRHERELCCDDLAVQASGGALCYARALTALEKMRGAHPAPALGSTDGPLFHRIRRLVAGSGEYGPSKLSGMVAISLGVLCLALCVNWAHGQEPTRAFAITIGSAEDGPGVAVDTAGAALIHRTGIEYPHALIAKRVEGTVSVEATLDSSGNVVDAHVLSGPEELRKAALSSVLNWHFAPGSGNTRVVRIGFRPPDQAVETEPEHKQEGEVRVRVPATYTTRADQTEEVRSQVAELQHKLETAHTVGNLEERAQEREREPVIELNRSMERLRVRQSEERFRRERIGSKVAAIEIRGLSDAAGSDLLSRLPVHEGDTLTEQSMEGAGRAIRQFDEHLEFNYGWEPEGVVLRIHPAGAAGAPLLQRK
jgi:TonB family protein